MNAKRSTLFLGLFFALAACDAPPADPPEKSSTSASRTAPDLTHLPAPYSSADWNKGRRQFTKCRSCHLTAEGGGHRVGPNLFGLFSRSVGTAEGFDYSDALDDADFIWTPKELDEWLANPKQYLPGNRMTFVGIAAPEQRKNLIAYLLVETAAQTPPEPAAPVEPEDASLE